MISPKEAEVLKFIAQGLTNIEISRKMRLSDQTIKNHISSIFKKTGTNNRTLLALYALKMGYVSQQEIDKILDKCMQYAREEMLKQK
jgi:DNA-binding NarL/FixJ family response regulator